MIKFKEKTREELIVSFKWYIDRKRQFEEEAPKEFVDMRKRGFVDMRKRGAALKSTLWNPLTNPKPKTPLVLTIDTTRTKHKHMMW